MLQSLRTSSYSFEFGTTVTDFDIQANCFKNNSHFPAISFERWFIYIYQKQNFIERFRGFVNVLFYWRVDTVMCPRVWKILLSHEICYLRWNVHKIQSNILLRFESNLYHMSDNEQHTHTHTHVYTVLQANRVAFSSIRTLKHGPNIFNTIIWLYVDHSELQQQIYLVSVVEDTPNWINTVQVLLKTKPLKTRGISFKSLPLN